MDGWRVYERAYQLELYSASSVRKCSWKGFLLSGLERNVSGDSATANADRARQELLSLLRVKNKFTAAFDRVAIFGILLYEMVDRSVGSSRLIPRLIIKMPIVKR